MHFVGNQTNITRKFRLSWNINDWGNWLGVPKRDPTINQKQKKGFHGFRVQNPIAHDISRRKFFVFTQKKKT